MELQWKNNLEKRIEIDHITILERKAIDFSVCYL